jgi:two-component system C4-dicarboxylate transport response regulator DctD
VSNHRVGERGDILIIEDDPDVGLLLLDVFDSHGVTTALLAHPREIAAELDPSVVLSDLFGPPWYDRTSAVTHVTAIRKRFPSASIVLLTAFLEAAGDQAEIGADVVVAKPFDVDDLLQTVLSLAVPAEHAPTEVAQEG